MQLEQDATASAVRRLRRAEGQIAGVIRMLEEGRECKDVVTQLAAASKAIDRAGFQIIASGLRQCFEDPENVASQEDLERLFMSLA
jgi:DNA-binding FrmR family transcriptional regulator